MTSLTYGVTYITQNGPEEQLVHQRTHALDSSFFDAGRDAMLLTVLVQLATAAWQSHLSEAEES